MCDSPSTSATRLLRSGVPTALFVAWVVVSSCAFGQDTTTVAIDDPGIELLENMVRVNPDDRSFRIRLAEALFEAGRYEEAATHYAEYVSAAQASPQLVRRYLFALSQTDGVLTTGERVALQYSRIYPTDAEIQMRLGTFRLWLGKYRLALEACTRAMRLDPENGHAETCVEQASNPPSGVGSSSTTDRLAREVRAEPGNDELRYRLVAAFIHDGRFQEAWDQLLILEPEHGRSAHWLDTFLQVESGLVRADGSSPVYPVDRYTFLLRARPEDDRIRLRLVDLLIEEDRFGEALTVLTAPGRLDIRDSAYADRLRLIVDRREAFAHQRIASLTDSQDDGPLEADALEELTTHYLTLGRGRDALATCEQLIDAYPRDSRAGAFCMKVYADLSVVDRALDEANRLLSIAPTDAALRRDVLVVRLGAGESDAEILRTLEDMLGGQAGSDQAGSEPASDPDLLLTAAATYAGLGRLEQAREMLARLPASDRTAPFASRREAVEQLIEREEVRSRIEAMNERLREARRLASAGHVDASTREYEHYFEERGIRTRPELIELADVHAAAGEYEKALSILHALEDRFHDADVTKRIARIRMDAGDAGGALASLDMLIAERPRDWEARLWRADVLAGLGFYEDALAVYENVPEATGRTYAVEVRRNTVENEMRGGGDVGDWSGLDYAGILAPSADGVRARGGGTSYDRWAQGMQTHVTTPVGLVILAGIDSHFLSGTRRLVPGAETVNSRINRIWVGGIHDFTPQIRSERASYTNRLTIEGGLFDYEGGRTMPFASVRYWRQEPGVYDGSIGVRSTEGSLDLWSPAGGQYDLRITQFNAKGTTTALAADSTIRVAGNVSLNLVTDNIGSTLEGERNVGSNIRLEAGYRVATDTYLGVEYQGIDFRSTVDIYWSPQNYSQYDIFLEYEGEVPLRWYLRLRAAMGMVARSDGFVTRRLEADYIRRLDDNFSISIRTGLSASARSTGSSGASVLDRYNSASFGAALYWTL